HMHLFASRLIGPLRFLNPVALAKASAVNIKHRRGAAASLRTDRSRSPLREAPQHTEDSNAA
ncbi:hypothetical protein ACIRUK_27700, partial [Streptomyces sp. NPDC101150]